MMSPDPDALSRWELVKSGVPLALVMALLTNLGGLWATGSQLASRAAAHAKAEERSRYAEELRPREEEMRKRQEDMERRRKEFEESMRRAFGR